MIAMVLDYFRSHFFSAIHDWLGSCKRKDVQDSGSSRPATVAASTLVAVKQYASE
jgi:hypothetical protein